MSEGGRGRQKRETIRGTTVHPLAKAIFELTLENRLRHEWLEDALYVNPDQVAQDRFGDWNSPQAVLQAAQYCEEQREIADRMYVYDNSIDDTEAHLLFRMTDGKLFKCYTDDIPSGRRPSSTEPAAAEEKKYPPRHHTDASALCIRHCLKYRHCIAEATTN